MTSPIENLKTAITTHDNKLLLTTIDSLRFGCGYTYQDIQNLAEKHCQIDADEFELRMQELDYLD